MKHIALTAVLSLASVTVHAYSSLEELLDAGNRQQVEALKTYIADNPEAADIAEARERLVYSLVSINDYAGAIGLLEDRYNDLPADKAGLDLSVAFGEIVAPLIQMYRLDGRKQDGIEFIAKVREDFKAHEMNKTINEALDEFSGMFNAPGVGESLEISFTSMDGRKIDLAEFKGRVVLVDFWATWCVPCLKTMPGLKEIYAQYKDQGFEIIGISLDDDEDKLKSYLEKEGIAWPQYYDGKGWENELATKYGIESIPATFLIGKDGLVAGNDLPEAALKAKIAELLTVQDKAPPAPAQ